MASLNKVQIIGNLGKNPEVRMTPNGQKVANFSVAVTEKYNDRNGQQHVKTEWFNVIFWAKLAEICEQYLKKGSSVYIEGKLETRTWENDGIKNYKTEIRGISLQMLGGRTESNSDEYDYNQDRQNNPMPDYSQMPEPDSDLPF